MDCGRSIKAPVTPVPNYCSHWLVPVNDLSEITNPSRDHAFILPDDSIWVLDFEGNRFIQIGSAIVPLKPNIPPVGSVIQNVLEEFNPVEEYPGTTWERYAQGRVPVGVDEDDPDFDTAGKSGGEKEQHLRAAIGAVNGSDNTLGYATASPISGQNYTYASSGTGISIDRVNHSTLVKTQDGQEPSTLQPYISVYMWVRVA